MREQATGRAPSDCDPRFVSRGDIQRWFEEWIVSRQLVTGRPDYIFDYATGPTGGFYANELGFGWRNGDKDVLQTARTLRADNAARKERLRKRHENLQEKLMIKAKREGKRPVLEPWRDAQGCTGCSSCVAGARIAPEVIRLTGNFADWQPTLTPGSRPRALREQLAVMSFLKTAAAAVRRARAEERSAAYKERRERNAPARAAQKRRRAEANMMEAAERRAIAGGTTRRRLRV